MREKERTSERNKRGGPRGPKSRLSSKPAGASDGGAEAEKAPARPTIVEVAKRAGVSIATVSRALNQTGRYDKETYRRIKKIAEEIGYAPNYLARSLRKARTGQIALAVADVGNPVYVAMAKAIQQVAKANGYRLVLLSTEARVDEEVSILRSLVKGYVDGLILSPLKYGEEHVRELKRVALPVVIIGGGINHPLDGEVEGVDRITVDSAFGARLAMEHLLGQGYTRIALVNGPEDTVPGAARAKGYREAHIEHGLRPDPELSITTEFTLSGGYEAGGALLALKQRPEAVFCANDLMALGVMRRLREAGLRIPEDMAVVGMDDIEHAAISTPTLTTVSLMAAERGRLAAESLLARLNAPDPWGPSRVIEVTPRLVVRESSLSYRSRAASI